MSGTLARRGKELNGDVEVQSARLTVTGNGRIMLSPQSQADLTFRFHDSSLDPYVRLFVPRLSPFTTAVASGTLAEFALPFDASWTPDLWGRVRNTVLVNVSGAQATAADLENIRLTMQAELAVDFYELRAQDALQELFDATVRAYRDSLEITQAQLRAGITSDETVAQAETQLEATEAQDINLGILRAQNEHAIALLVGQPASVFSVAAAVVPLTPPTIPAGVPSAWRSSARPSDRSNLALAISTGSKVTARPGKSKVASAVFWNASMTWNSG